MMLFVVRMTCFVTPKMNPHCKKSQQDLLRQTTTRTTTKDRRRKTKDDDGVDTNKDYGDDRDTDDVVRSSFCHSLLHDNDLVVNNPRRGLWSGSYSCQLSPYDKSEIIILIGVNCLDERIGPSQDGVGEWPVRWAV